MRPFALPPAVRQGSGCSTLSPAFGGVGLLSSGHVALPSLVLILRLFMSFFLAIRQSRFLVCVLFSYSIFSSPLTLKSHTLFLSIHAYPGKFITHINLRFRKHKNNF